MNFGEFKLYNFLFKIPMIYQKNIYEGKKVTLKERIFHLFFINREIYYKKKNRNERFSTC